MFDISHSTNGAAAAGPRGLLSSWFLYGGRIGRKRYWLLTIIYTFGLALGGAALIGGAIAVDPGDSFLRMLPFAVIAIVFVLAFTAASLSAVVRRLHDRGKSGFWVLLYYVAPGLISDKVGLSGDGLVFLAITIGVGIWSLVDLGLLRGDTGSNAFGPDPLAEKVG